MQNAERETTLRQLFMEPTLASGEFLLLAWSETEQAMITQASAESMAEILEVFAEILSEWGVWDLDDLEIIDGSHPDHDELCEDLEEVLWTAELSSAQLQMLASYLAQDHDPVHRADQCAYFGACSSQFPDHRFVIGWSAGMFVSAWCILFEEKA